MTTHGTSAAGPHDAGPPAGFVVIDELGVSVAPLDGNEPVPVPVMAVLRASGGLQGAADRLGPPPPGGVRPVRRGGGDPVPVVLAHDGVGATTWDRVARRWVPVPDEELERMVERFRPLVPDTAPAWEPEPAAPTSGPGHTEGAATGAPEPRDGTVADRPAASDPTAPPPATVDSGAGRRRLPRVLERVAARFRRVPGPASGPVGPDRERERGPEPDREQERVRVVPVYGAPGSDPSLALGMIVAHLWSLDDDRYDVQPPMTTPEPLWEELDRSGAPMVALFADYSWTLDLNLATSRELKRRSPGSLTVHGGPHVPREPSARDAFMRDHPEVDVVVRFEGELTTADLLDAIGGDLSDVRTERLAQVAGLTFRDGDDLIHTPDRDRTESLGDLPSPFLSGVFDHIDPAEWRIATVETTRGCPYRCAFCDWGSATGSRTRWFPVERVREELEWISRRGVEMLFIADANFGESERDVDLARWIAELRTRHGAPRTVIASFAKNNADHITDIVDIWRRAGIGSEGLTALQTVDPTTLRNIRRQNIPLEVHDQLTERFRERGLPLLTDLLVGLPGSDVTTFKADLQRCIDLEVTPRIAEVEVLPNSPLTQPDYVERMQLRFGPKGTISATYSCPEEVVEEMLRLRLLFRAGEHYGILRHVLRYAQHEHGVRAADLLHDIDGALVEDPRRWPGLAWVGRYLDLFLLPPVDWEPFYDEVVSFLGERHGIAPGPGLRTVVEVQRALMPAPGRTFPHTVELEHDYVAWFRSLPHTGPAQVAPLTSYGPGRLTVTDPDDVCGRLLRRNHFETRRDQVAENLFWMVDHWELASELERPLAANARGGPAAGGAALVGIDSV